MVICPSCQSQEAEGALFCSECGAQLLHKDLVTQNIGTNELGGESLSEIPPKEERTFTIGSISLQLLEGGQFLPLKNRKEFTMGRVSVGQTIMPDIDLTPHGAFDSGVSRLHAVLRNSEGRVTIMDLGSSNGTYVDGTRLEPERENSLSHGSIISLGKLKIQFLLQK
ncbi:MAG: FHA domain-containing protein [Anaerolineales bacterium]|nr:FHA domain-containing protein [Anaerolineales bacterium]